MKKSLCEALILTVCTFIISCSSDKQEIDLEANRDVVKNYHSVWSNGQVSGLDKILAPNFVCHFINGIEWKGIEGAKNSISSHRKSFPDWKEEIVDMVSEGDKVVTRYKSTGTHQEAFEALVATVIK
jgi:ketosteroid isomerase-like protein